MTRAACVGAVIAAMSAVACGGSDATPPQRRETVAPSPQPSDTSDDVPDTRRCGEPGERVTVLPPGLREGTERVGDVVLAAGQTKNVGRIELEYDTDAWIGTMNVGHPGPMFVATIDRAEVGEHEAWGGRAELSADRRFRFHVGPYRFDGEASSEEPPTHVSVRVERRRCPARTVTHDARTRGQIALPDAVEADWLRRASSMWLSTEGIRLHTLMDERGMLQVSLESSPEGPPRLEIHLGLYTHWMEPRPGETRAFRVDDRVVTVDEVVLAPPSRAREPARAHARVRVEPAPARAAVPIRGEAMPCGGPATEPRPLPRELPQSCPESLEVPPPTEGASTFLWLGTRGSRQLIVKTPERQTLSLSVHPDAATPTLSGSSEHASLSHQLRPDIGRRVASMDALEVELLEVIAGTGTRIEESRWVAERGTPAVHVLVRLSRE